MNVSRFSVEFNYVPSGIQNTERKNFIAQMNRRLGKNQDLGEVFSALFGYDWYQNVPYNKLLRAAKLAQRQEYEYCVNNKVETSRYYTTTTANELRKGEIKLDSDFNGYCAKYIQRYMPRKKFLEIMNAKIIYGRSDAVKQMAKTIKILGEIAGKEAIDKYVKSVSRDMIFQLDEAVQDLRTIKEACALEQGDVLAVINALLIEQSGKSNFHITQTLSTSACLVRGSAYLNTEARIEKYARIREKIMNMTYVMNSLDELNMQPERGGYYVGVTPKLANTIRRVRKEAGDELAGAILEDLTRYNYVKRDRRICGVVSFVRKEEK